MPVQPKVVYTFTVPTVHRLLNLPSRLQYRLNRNYQSTMAPGVPTLINIISSASHTCSCHERAL
jgi:hypothetical protein